VVLLVLFWITLSLLTSPDTNLVNSSSMSTFAQGQPSKFIVQKETKEVGVISDDIKHEQENHMPKTENTPFNVDESKLKEIKETELGTKENKNNNTKTSMSRLLHIKRGKGKGSHTRTLNGTLSGHNRSSGIVSHKMDHTNDLDEDHEESEVHDYLHVHISEVTSSLGDSLSLYSSFSDSILIAYSVIWIVLVSISTFCIVVTTHLCKRSKYISTLTIDQSRIENDHSIESKFELNKKFNSVGSSSVISSTPERDKLNSFVDVLLNTNAINNGLYHHESKKSGKHQNGSPNYADYDILGGNGDIQVGIVNRHLMKHYRLAYQEDEIISDVLILGILYDIYSSNINDKESGYKLLEMDVDIKETNTNGCLWKIKHNSKYYMKKYYNRIKDKYYSSISKVKYIGRSDSGDNYRELFDDIMCLLYISFLFLFILGFTLFSHALPSNADWLLVLIRIHIIFVNWIAYVLTESLRYTKNSYRVVAALYSLRIKIRDLLMIYDNLNRPSISTTNVTKDTNNRKSRSKLLRHHNVNREDISKYEHSVDKYVEYPLRKFLLYLPLLLFPFMLKSLYLVLILEAIFIGTLFIIFLIEIITLDNSLESYLKTDQNRRQNSYKASKKSQQMIVQKKKEQRKVKRKVHQVTHHNDDDSSGGEQLMDKNVYIFQNDEYSDNETQVEIPGDQTTIFTHN